MLSILMPVYNHEKYLHTALQSIEMQNIACRYEVLIGEDCSTDHSREILKAYQEHALPNYQFIYREQNEGMFANVSDLFSRAKGKYIIALEGDDYWIYKNKINEQIQFLEDHPEYSGCAHRVVVVDGDGRKRDMDYPAEKKSGDYTLSDYLKNKLPGQTASFLYRNYFREKNLFDYLHHNESYPLDRFVAFVAASNGAVACRKCRWSAYRYVTDQGSSFSASCAGRNKTEIADGVLRYHRSIYEYAVLEKKGRQCVQVSEKLFFKSYLRSWVQGGCRDTRKMLRALRQAKYPAATFTWVFVKIIMYLFEQR